MPQPFPGNSEPMIALDSVEQRLVDLRKLEKEYVAAFSASDRLEELGAGNYYIQRLRHNQLLPAPEWEVLRFVLQNFPVSSHIVEIGCGWGQLLALAAASGYSCTGIDYSIERLRGAEFLRDLVMADFEIAADRLQYLRGDYPSSWDFAIPRLPGAEEGPLIGFFSNLGLNRSEEFCEACVVALQRFDHVIMDVNRFFSDRSELDVQNSFIEKMKRFGVRYASDIYYQAGAYRFIWLTVEDKTLFPSVKKTRDRVSLIDLCTTPVVPVRATLEVLLQDPVLGYGERVLRVREDNTAGDGHDIRLVYSGKTAKGAYELVAALRARERRMVCIFLHSHWLDHVRLIFDVGRGVASIEQVVGDTFRVDNLRCETFGDWTYFKAQVEIVNELDEVAVAMHLANGMGRYYYDGDGISGIDVRMVSFYQI